MNYMFDIQKLKNQTASQSCLAILGADVEENSLLQLLNFQAKSRQTYDSSVRWCPLKERTADMSILDQYKSESKTVSQAGPGLGTPLAGPQAVNTGLCHELHLIGGHLDWASLVKYLF